MVLERIRNFIDKLSVGGGYMDVIEEKNVKEGQVWKTSYPENDRVRRVEILDINKYGHLQVRDLDEDVEMAASPDTLDELVQDV